MAVAHERLGAYDQAIERQRDKQTMFKSIPDADKNQQVQRGLQNAEYEIGRMELARGRVDAAETHALASVALAEKMVAADPENLFWLGQSSVARLLLAEVQLAQGKRQAAREAVERTQPDVARLLASDATKVVWQVGLSGSALALAAEIGEYNRTILIEELNSFIAKVRALVQDGKKLLPGQLLVSANAEFQLGRLLHQHGRQNEAMAHWRAVVASIASFQQESNFHLLTLLARAKLALGERDAAQELVRRIEVSAYRHPNYADLVNEMARGKGPVPLSNNRSKP